MLTPTKPYGPDYSITPTVAEALTLTWYSVDVLSHLPDCFAPSQDYQLEDGELLIVATQIKPHSAIADYAKRWGIETLFGIFKSRGFRLEETHLRHPKRLSKLFALLTLTLGWVLCSGEWLNSAKPIALKFHGRRAKSLFRYGLDYLRSIVLNTGYKAEQFSQALQVLSCT